MKPDKIKPSKSGGCDICQDVCPWNKKSIVKNQNLALNKDLLNMTQKDWENFRPEMFEKISKDSPMNGKTYEQLKRNIELAK